MPKHGARTEQAGNQQQRRKGWIKREDQAARQQQQAAGQHGQQRAPRSIQRPKATLPSIGTSVTIEPMMPIHIADMCSDAAIRGRIILMTLSGAAVRLAMAMVDASLPLMTEFLAQGHSCPSSRSPRPRFS